MDDLFSRQKEIIRNLTDAKRFAENIIETIRESLLILDSELRVISANTSFYNLFKVNKEETEGQLLYDLGNKQWDIPKLKKLLENILPENSVFNDYLVDHDFKDLGKRYMLLNARRIEDYKIILLAIADVTDRINHENMLKMKNIELQNAFSEIKELRGILPICSYCKKIRDDKGYWEQIEVYVHNHTDADFSHSICPDCLKIHYPELEI